jgi:hypothetical protein
MYFITEDFMLRFGSFLLITAFMLVLACALVKPGTNLGAEEETIRKGS